MDEFTTKEVFFKGITALESKNYEEAEHWFLSAIYDYSKTGNDYLHDMGSRTQLAELYSQGLGPDKERAKAFFATFVGADRYVSSLYSVAQKNGIVSESNPDNFIYPGKTIDKSRIEFFSNEKFRPTLDIIISEDSIISEEEARGQKGYDEWTLNNPVQMIIGVNARGLNEKEIEFIKKAKPKKILDVGPGDGRRLFSYLRQEGIEFIGIEKFERLAAESEYSSDIIITDILAINFLEHASRLSDIDTVTVLGGSLNGVFGFANHLIAWKNIVDLLPAKGIVIFDSPIMDGFEDQEEVGVRQLHPTMAPPQFFLSEVQLRNIWAELNLSIVDQSDIQIPAPFNLRYYLLEK